MPTVSIIMGIYNCEKTLPQAIDSILSQTYTDWELILCDDGSTDSTYSMAKTYQQNYPDRIILIQNDHNLGLPLTLNHCLTAAKGVYIARMDGDDISLPDRLQKQVDFLKNHPTVDCVGTGMIRFDENGEFDRIYPIAEPNKFTLKMYPLCYHATIIMKKTAYDAIGGYVSLPRTQRCEDIDMWFRFAANGFHAANLNECLYKVREDRAALKRRKFKYAVNLVKTNFSGFHLLNYPFYLYPFAFKPLLSHIVPYRIKVLLNNRKNKQ